MTTVARVAKRQWMAGIVVALWAWLLYFGTRIYAGAASRGIAGLPSQKQMVLYIGVPAAMIVAGIFLIVAGRKIPLWIFTVVFFFVVAALVPVFLLFGGGV